MNQKLNKFFRLAIDRLFPNQEAFAFCVGAIVLIVGLYYFIDVLLPILLSIILAFVLFDPMIWLERRGVPKLAFSLVVLFLLFGLTVLFFVVFAPIIWQESLTFISLVPELGQNTRHFLQQYLQDIPFVETETVQQFVTTMVSQLTVSTQQILSFSLSSLVSVIWGVLYCVLIPVLVFFFLYDSESIQLQMSTWFLNDSALLQTIWHQTLIDLMHYIRGKLVELLVVGCGSYLALAIFSMKSAFLLGLATGVAVLVPYVGALIAGFAVVVVGLYQWGLDPTLVYVLMVYSAVQILDAYLLVPWLFSSTLNLRPITILVAITFFGGLWGMWGVLIAIPLATFIKVVFLAWPKAHST